MKRIGGIAAVIGLGLGLAWFGASATAGGDGFVSLFNGKNLDGWKKIDSKKDVWLVEKEMIVCTGSGGGWLGTEREYANFELRLEYRLEPGGNAGLVANRSVLSVFPG